MDKQATKKRYPLTDNMKEMLMECHERELLQLDPCSTYFSRFTKGLVERGLITAKPFFKNGKTFMAFFITNAGIEYLDKL